MSFARCYNFQDNSSYSWIKVLFYVPLVFSVLVMKAGWKFWRELSVVVPRKVPRYEDDNIRDEMVSGSGSGEWRVKGRLLTSVQYYSTIKGPLETLEMLNLRLYILSSLYLTQTGEGTIYSLYSASFYPVLSNEVLFEIFRGSLISDISCLAYGWHLLCYTGWFLQYLMRADFIVLGTGGGQIRGFKPIWILCTLLLVWYQSLFCVTIILFCHLVEGYYWQQSPYYPRSAVCCHLNGENRFPPPQSPYDIHHYNYPRS